MALKEKYNIAAAQTLTGSYVVADTKNAVACDGDDVASLAIVYTTGAAETGTTCQFKIEFSHDGTNWFQEQTADETAGTVSYTAVEHSFGGGSAATAYKALYNFALIAKQYRVSFKETGQGTAGVITSADVTVGSGVSLGSGFGGGGGGGGTSEVDVTKLGGTAIATGTGVDGAGVQRISLATNVALPAGTNALGTVTTAPTAVSGYQFYEDTSFVTGDSPASIDVNTDLGRNGVDGSIINDGPGNFTFTIDSGSGAGDAITMKSGEEFSFEGMDIDTIAITWVSDSAYRVAVK